MFETGGLNPLPVPLNAAKQFNRACSTLANCGRTSKFCWIRVSVDGSTATVQEYDGQNGTGSDHAPTATRIGTGSSTLDFAGSHEDDYGVTAPVNIRAVLSGALTTSNLGINARILTPQQIHVQTYNMASGATVNADYCLAVW
jgi:hypothetical protein